MSEVVGSEAESQWEVVLRAKLPLFGHRNWVVIADSAYPFQSQGGITTIATSDEQLNVVAKVLEVVGAASHVKPIVYVDHELGFVREEDAPGVADYRVRLAQLLEYSKHKTIPHEEIIERLDRAGQRFHVLIIKTEMTIPYTSVFLELDCGYWSAEAEAGLRAAMRGE